jgi:transcriptional regulator with XRE-family HTH domain
MAKRNPASLSEGLRAAIRSSGMSLRAIGGETGIDVAVLSRFMNKKGGLSLDGIERLADALGVEVVVKPAPRPHKAK